MHSGNLERRLYLIAAVILLVGLGGAVIIYLSADNDSADVTSYEMTGGYSYPMAPEDSKRYRHDLELYGGKANVIVYDFTRWFAGLWRGRSLAFTIACIAIVLSLGLFFVANRLPSDRNSGGEDRKDHSGKD